MMLKSKIIIFFLLLNFSLAFGQEIDQFSDESDLEISGDIFSDFTDDVVGMEMSEDERYYRFGRFFSFEIGVGQTTYDGNRGSVYLDDPPSFALQLNYFMNFRVSVGVGFEYSSHHFTFTEAVGSFPSAPGLISVGALRAFFGYRYYIDTTNLSTAITYSNPYFTGRIEYWYMTNKFENQTGLENDTGGGLGFGTGFGLEFPLEIKKTYIGVEFLFHTVDYHDKFTNKYMRLPDGNQGVDDLSGNSYSTKIFYVLNW